MANTIDCLGMQYAAGFMIDSRYEVKTLIGEGGSAQVYCVRDSHMERDVALKVMHERVLESDRRRFLREVSTLARLSHPGIVSVLDMGEGFDGRPFFTMPLMSGGSITSIGTIEDALVNLSDFLNIAQGSSRALHYIHSHGIIHRDLTPGNILLDSAKMPRIMDFGLVALSEHTRHITRSGVTLGTPIYMAPEQAKGDGVDARSDLYALGAVLFRVACGTPPFSGDSDQSILYQHVYEAAPDPRDINPAIPNAIARVLTSLLSKRPDRRPQSGEALAHLWDLAQRELWVSHIRGQYRGGKTRTGEHPDGPSRVSDLHESWSVPLPGEVTWPSAVVGEADLIAVGTRGGQLVLTHSSGRPFATYAAKDEVTAPATFVGGHVLYGSWDGTLRRVDLYSGSQIWQHQARAEFTGSPMIWGDLVLATSRDGHLYALSERTGELVWAYRAMGPLAASPLAWGGAALLCDEGGWLHAIDGKSGKPLWKVEVGAVHGTPALMPTKPSEAILVVATWSGEVHALKLRVVNGRVSVDFEDPSLWTYDLENEIWASPAVSKLPAIGHNSGKGVVIIAGWGGKVKALDLEKGDDIWAHDLKGRITASPVISTGMVFIASELGELVALDVLTGQLRWLHNEAHGVQATPLAASGTLYVAFMNGTLRAYRDNSVI